jgi:hypothetical protein
MTSLLSKCYLFACKRISCFISSRTSDEEQEQEVESDGEELSALAEHYSADLVEKTDKGKEKTTKTTRKR